MPASAAGGPITSTNSPRVSSSSATAAEFGNRGASHFLMQLGHFTADRGVAFAHDAREILQRILHPRAALEHHQRGVDARQFRKTCAAPRPASTAGSLRRKNRSVGQRRNRQRGQHRRRTWQRDHVETGRADLAHQLESGIGNQRGAGVGHQRDGRALRELLQDLRPRHRGVVLVILHQRRGDGENRSISRRVMRVSSQATDIDARERLPARAG